MSGVVEWWLGLDRIRLGRDAPLALRWTNAVPLWVVFGCVVLAFVAVVWVYRREQAPRWRRVLLGALRLAAIGFVALLVRGPALVLQRNRVEPSTVMLLVDASRSMARTDVYGDASLAEALRTGAGLADGEDLAGLARLDLVRRAFVGDDGAALRALVSHNRLEVYAFAGSVRPVASGGSVEDLPALTDALNAIEADGRNTDLAGALNEALGVGAGLRVSAVVLVSDGNATTAPDLFDIVAQARQRDIPVYTVPIGSGVAPVDLVLGVVRSPEIVFANDVLAVRADVSAMGMERPMPIVVRLIDEATDQSVAQKTVRLGGDVSSVTVELRTRPTSPGQKRYRVEVVPVTGERVLENNRARVDVLVVEETLRVLYVETYPRYEYRFLKNALLRERTVTVSVLLLEADEGFVQEGTEPIRRFPETPEEMNHYDVLLFGDVDPRGDWLSPGQMRMILDYVGNRGGGFGLIAGERYVPQAFFETPLSVLVPVRIDPGFLGRHAEPLTGGFRPRLTPEGRASRLFRFYANEAGGSEGADVLASLPSLYWCAATLGAKPGATVLAEHPTDEANGKPAPIIVTGRYGAGKLFFQATDDTWRWRRHAGEFLHDAYWVQVVRALMPARGARADSRLVVTTDRRFYRPGEPIHVQVEVRDADLLAMLGGSVRGVVSDDTGHPVVRFEAQRVGPDANRFDAMVPPPGPGGYVLRVDDVRPRLGERPAEAIVRIGDLDLESRHVQADRALLIRLAEATGGRTVGIDRLAEAFSHIEDRGVRVPDDIVEPLWDSKLVLVVFVLIVGTEWALRKVFGLP